MLALDQTALLMDGLKSPPGMEIDIALGTTFTLDLTALLAIPVAASLTAAERDDDSAGLLETLRRYGDRTVLFCQAGSISVPTAYRAALTLVEQTVIEVAKPPGGIFHPKVWVVRFAGGGTLVHRVLVMSRNLTFDRSWDVVVRLDEEPDAPHAMDNTGIVEFVRALPALTTRLTRSQDDLVADLSGTLASARLAVPSPFESGSFEPLLGTSRQVPFRRSCDHALAISPFLTGDVARTFLRTGKDWAGVISRPAALDACADDLRDCHTLLRLKDAVLDAERTIDDTFDNQGASETGDVASAADAHQRRGLHAKVYVQDHGTRSTSRLGSANLTSAAFTTNVEMLVRLTGPVGLVGVDALLNPKPQTNNLSWFVESHALPDVAVPDTDDEIEELEGHCLDLASSDFCLAVTEAGDHWDLHLTATPWEPPASISVRARLLSLGNEPPTAVVDGTVVWRGIPLGLITPFVVLEVRAGESVRRTLVRARLVGDPPDRRQGVIADAIASRDDFLRYLSALLGLELTPAAGVAVDGSSSGGWAAGGTSSRVLEDLLTTASRNPERLATLDETLTLLRRRADVATIVPDDFHALWDAVYAARMGTRP